MAHLLVHIHSGPDQPVKATLGCLVALTAAKAGHRVSVFFAGDGVHLLAPAWADLTGAGTGRLGDHLAGLAQAGAEIVASERSAEARGYGASLVSAHGGRFGMPDALVALTFAADRALCY